MALSVDVIPNRSSPPAILLREAWREGKRIRRRTLVNLSKMPPALLYLIRAGLAGGGVFPSLDAAVTIRRSLPHGHVAAVLGMARHLGLERILHRRRSRMRDLALAAIVSRIIASGSKLATARALSPETATSSLGAVLGLGKVSGNEMLEMLDWLLKRQPRIEGSLARRHLAGGTLVLHDVSSSYLEGKQCPLAEFGPGRDGKRGKTQVTCGLLCSEDGCPVAIEVFAGNTADPQTLGAQVKKIRERFGIERIALVGDRGMLTTARIREELLMATEEVLAGIAAAHERGRQGAAGRDRTWKAPGRKANRKKVEKHFDIRVTDAEVVWARSEERIDEEARLDGIRMVRTSPGADAIGTDAAVEAYKSLARVERAFRMARSDLGIRPVYVHTATHVRAHVFLCMLALHVEWHMRRRLVPILFEDDEPDSARAARASPVEPACVSESARDKAASKTTPDGLPVHGFRTLLDDLATLTLNEVSLPGNPDPALPLLATPTQLQSRAFELLNIDPVRMLPCT